MGKSLVETIGRKRTFRVKIAGALVASLGLMAAVGCTSAPDANVDEPTSSVTLAMEYADGGDMYNHESVEVTDAALVAEGAQLVNGVGAENTYVYKGFAHGDVSHYSMYSLYTELMTDENGLLVGVNVTSGADTWSGKWGDDGSKPVIYGMTPEGVTLDIATSEDGANKVITPTLFVEEGSEVDAAGYALATVNLFNVQDDLTTVGMDVENKKGRMVHYEYDATVDLESGENVDAETYSYDAQTNAITVKDGAYNLIQIQYLLGTEVYLEEWIAIDDNENALAYIGQNAEVTDLTVPEKVEGTGVTNRTKWTYTMLSLMEQREFASWGSTFEDVSLYTGGNDGEIGDLDTVSGATKTSVPFQSALNQAIEAGQVTGISENVKVTIDAGDPAADGIDVSGVAQDQTTVVKNEAGQYVITANFPAGVDEAADGDLQHAICPVSIDLYALGEENLGTLGVWNLGKGTSGYTPVASYADSQDEPCSASDAFVTYAADWEYPFTPAITIVDPSVTHVVISYEIGHEILGIAYDLEAMTAAGDVVALIEAMDASNAEDVAAAREAYDALSNDVKGVVSNADKLFAAEA